MRLNKPNFWDKKNSFFSILLYPLSLITLLIINLKKKFIKPKSFNIPIICVGNIYIGGTGKTPTSIYIAKQLSLIGFKPAILRKYYKDHTDEYNQIRHYFSNLIINKDRSKGLIIAKKEGYDTVILDDGLQDYKIENNLSIVCFHQNQLAGNGFILPAGPLRENLNRLKSVDIVLINGKKLPEFEKKLLNINKNLKIFYSSYKPRNINQFQNHNLLALAGIANPENFFNLLIQNNLSVQEKLVFPDHYIFTENELKNIIKKAKNKNLKIIMTEKDYFKINQFDLDELNYLKVSLEINQKEDFLNIIKRIYD